MPFQFGLLLTYPFSLCLPSPCSWPLCGHTLRALHGVAGAPSSWSWEEQTILSRTMSADLLAPPSLNNNKTCILKHFYRNYLSPQGKYVQTSLERWGICSVRCENMDSVLYSNRNSLGWSYGILYLTLQQICFEDEMAHYCFNVYRIMHLYKIFSLSSI